MKKAPGIVIKEARKALRMSQRELGAMIGVKSSHIAYIEGGQRRPSIRLLRKIADTLGLDPRYLLILSHPDTRYFLSPEDCPATDKDAAWGEFISNKALLRRHNITRAELRVLHQVSALEHVKYPEHFFYILNSIRQASVPLTQPRRRRTSAS